MRDLTQGSIARHLLGMAAFIGFGLVVQTLYLLIDLYFVAHLGKQALAGVATAASTSFVVMAASQLVAVGALSLIAQAVGRRDEADSQQVFEQSLSLGLFMSVCTLLLGYGLGGQGLAALAADRGTAVEARAYLFAFLPSLAVLFPATAMVSALRGTGVVGMPMVLQCGTVVLNAVLAPVLIVGWGTGHPLGVAGAGLASSIAAAVGLVVLAAVFNRLQKRLRLSVAGLRPKLAVWRRIGAVGWPSAAELFLMFVISAVVYWAIRRFGPQAQAGFGLGSRIMQSIFLPAMAVAFAVAPIAGQNYGARAVDRVRATFFTAAGIGSAIMLALTLLCQISPQVLVLPFTQEPAVVAVAAGYLRISSWNFVAVGLAFACSGMFQAFGDTRPSLISSSARLITFVIPAFWLTARPQTRLHDFWLLSVASVTLQAVTSLLLLRRQMRLKLGAGAERASMPLAAEAPVPI